MKLLRSTKDEKGENVPHLKITEAVFGQRNIVNNDYKRDSRVLYTFVTNTSFSQLLDRYSIKIQCF